MKLVFDLDGRDDTEAIGAITIKKEDLLSLKLPELGRLEDMQQLHYLISSLCCH